MLRLQIIFTSSCQDFGIRFVSYLVISAYICIICVTSFYTSVNHQIIVRIHKDADCFKLMTTHIAILRSKPTDFVICCSACWKDHKLLACQSSESKDIQTHSTLSADVCKCLQIPSFQLRKLVQRLKRISQGSVSCMASAIDDVEGRNLSELVTPSDSCTTHPQEMQASTKAWRAFLPCNSRLRCTCCTN